MLDRVLVYVRAVASGEKQGDPAIGRYLMDAFGAGTEDLEKGGFASSLQVCCHLTIICLVLILGAGYVDDVLPCEPRPRTGRSIFADGSGNSIAG